MRGCDWGGLLIHATAHAHEATTMTLMSAINAHFLSTVYKISDLLSHSVSSFCLFLIRLPTHEHAADREQSCIDSAPDKEDAKVEP